MGTPDAIEMATRHPDLSCSAAASPGGVNRPGERSRAGKAADGGYSGEYPGDDVADRDIGASFAPVDEDADEIRGRMAFGLARGTAGPDHLAATRGLHREPSGLGSGHSDAEIPGLGHAVDAMREQCAGTRPAQHAAAIRAAGGAR